MSNRRRPAPNAPGGAMGDVISDLHEEGHITPRQFRAAVAFLGDLQARHGSSGGLVMSVSERVQTSSRACQRPPGGPTGIAELDYRLNKCLRLHERGLMKFLVTGSEVARGALSDFGRINSGYKTARTTRAVAVGRIGALLDTLADEYLGPEGV